eukprot:343685-Amphidinium_carterae.1
MPPPGRLALTQVGEEVEAAAHMAVVRVEVTAMAGADEEGVLLLSNTRVFLTLGMKSSARFVLQVQHWSSGYAPWHH